MSDRRLALLFLTLLLLVTPAGAATPQCTPYPQPRLEQVYILCGDGTRMVSYWHRTLARWETAVLPPPSHPRDQRLPEPKAPWR